MSALAREYHLPKSLPPLQPPELLPPLLFTLLSFAMKDDDVCVSCIDCAS